MIVKSDRQFNSAMFLKAGCTVGLLTNFLIRPGVDSRLLVSPQNILLSQRLRVGSCRRCVDYHAEPFSPSATGTAAIHLFFGLWDSARTP